MNEDLFIKPKPINGDINELYPLQIKIVDKTEYEPLWNYLVKTYHYLGYENMIGPRIKYLVFYQDIPLAALSFNRASLKIGVRESFIGWQEHQKKILLKHIANNNRFLILPWVKVKNLASHILSLTLKDLRKRWFDKFGVELYLVETFVDKEKYKGTCYKAANWKYLGETRGFSKIGNAFVYHGNKKGVFVYFLNKKFNKLINSIPCRVTPTKTQKRVPNMMLSIPDWSEDIVEQSGVTETEVQKLGEMLDNYLSTFHNCYSRCDQRKYGEAFIKGLLSNLERKSIEPIALEYMDQKNVRTMQIFFKDSPWNDEMMMDLYQKRLASTISDIDGMINVDGCDFPKKGKESIGVFRQYCGILGKTENCQSGVFVGYSSKRGYGLVDRQLYIPKAWFGDEYASARKECELPQDVTFKTKNQIASEMINKIAESKILPAKWIGCDAAFGVDRDFLDSLPKQFYYFADVRSKVLVFESMPDMQIPVENKKFKHARPSFQPVSVESFVTNENIPWTKIVLAEGAKGPIVADVKCIRCVACSSTTEYRNYMAPREPVWLYIRRYADGRIKYSLCNAPEDMPLETLHTVATMRWPIEQCFEECKSFLGMGHYETRSWKAWNRHMLFVFLAHLFITEIRMTFKKNSNFNNAAG